ncbi:MAG: SpoIIIAH-like family protein [Oscillospiraceae bacterium]|jgi:stage III sporulation protein AH|nr:SpoIIIAH-like family protein [Oscillospiraceae bacterium]
MKSLKRNAVIITVVLFVCVAAYLNWSYSQDAATDAAATGDATPIALSPNVNTVGEDGGLAAEGESAGLFYDGAVASGYFAEARIGRRQARDAAVETLASVNNADGASQAVLDGALEKITAIAAFSQKEAEIEALIRAKGFADCVAFLSDDGVKITVPAPVAGLSSVDVAKITEVVTSETEFAPTALQIIEVKQN